MRVAVEGCAHGTLTSIYASIEKSCQVNSWSGIDLLIVGGDFQAVRNSYDLNCMSVPMKYRAIGDFHEYYSGARKAPYLTIFVGGNHEAASHLFELYYGGWVAPNIYYLGAANVIRCGPLRIAGLSGIWKGYNYNKPHHERLPYNQDDVKSFYHVRELDVRKLLQIRTQVDIGISHDWPRGVEWMGNWKVLFAKKDLFEADARAGTLGSVAAKCIMDRLRPPHWFSAHLHCKFSAVVDYGSKFESIGGLQSDIHKATTSHEDHMANDPKRDLVKDQKDAPIAPPADLQVNTDEIEIDMVMEMDSSESDTEKIPVKPTKWSVPTTESSIVPESVRAQLPASFIRPTNSQIDQRLPHPEAIRNEITRFLALDKCLPHRKFLQILEIHPLSEADPASPTRPAVLCYDKEWLAILRVFAGELALGDPLATIPPKKGEAQYCPLIEVEEAWVEANLNSQGKMTVPINFQLTAPTYDENVGVGARDQPKEYTNPQTSAFCAMLGIPNPFDLSEEERVKRMELGPKEVAQRRGEIGDHKGGRGRGNQRGGRGGGRGGARGRGFR